MPRTRKRALVTQVGLAVRRMGAQSVLSSTAMAQRFGLHPSELEVLDLIFVRKTVSAGELMQATGLTSGSVTALLDRLTAKRLVHRERDRQDRRRICVRLNRKATAPIEVAYRQRQAAMFALWSSFDETALQVIVDFLTRSTDLLVESTSRRSPK